MRDSYAGFEAEGIKLYAVSYDDQETLREFIEARGIPFPLLSDIDSAVIRQYGILDTQVSKDEPWLYGIPFPGVYICDEAGIVVSRFFQDTYKKRESPETLIDAALGRIQIDEDAPQASGGDEDIQVTVAVRGGKGSLRQGIIRHLVVRFNLAEGLHIYGEPVPEGLTATTVSVGGHEGLETLPAEYPPTERLHLATLDVDLEVWSGEVDIVIPFYPMGKLPTESQLREKDSATLDIEVCYQACNDRECLLPRTERFTLGVALELVDVPNIPVHRNHGQRLGSYDGTPALRRLMRRKSKKSPLSALRFLWKNLRTRLAARRRRKNKRKQKNQG